MKVVEVEIRFSRLSLDVDPFTLMNLGGKYDITITVEEKPAD